MNQSNNNNAANPESLYRHFMTHRKNVPPASDTPDSSVSNIDDDLASVTYQQFKKVRRKDKALAVDNIMHAIKKANDEHIIEDQPQQSDAAAQKIHNINGERANVHTGLTGFGKIAAFAVAATLVALVIVPLWTNNTESVMVPEQMAQAVSDEFSENITEIANLLEIDNLSTYGFSGKENPAAQAFKAGTTATNLYVMIGAGNSAQANLIIQSDTLPIELSDKLSNQLNLSSSPDQASDQVNAVLKTLSQHSEEIGQSDWFAIGKSIQAIVLASEYALTTSDTAPLDDAIALARSLPQPATETAAGGLVNKLINDNYEQPLSIAEVRKILNTANNIKALSN